MVGDVQMRHRTEPQNSPEATADQASRTRRDFRCPHWKRQGRCRDRQWRRRVADEILPRDIKHDDSMLHTVTLAKFNAYFLKQVLPRATRTMLIPEAAICRANSLPIPDEAPVTSAQGPNLFLSSATVIFSLRSACLGLVVFVVS